MSPYRDSATRFSAAHHGTGLAVGSPRSSALARDAASSLHYPTSASRPASPSPDDGEEGDEGEGGEEEDGEGLGASGNGHDDAQREGARETRSSRKRRRVKDEPRNDGES